MRLLLAEFIKSIYVARLTFMLSKTLPQNRLIVIAWVQMRGDILRPWKRSLQEDFSSPSMESVSSSRHTWETNIFILMFGIALRNSGSLSLAARNLLSFLQ